MIFKKNACPVMFVAPMAGITDKSFRQICKEHGADITVSEMVSAKGLYYKDKKTAELLSFDEIERPIGIQLFGSEPDIIEYAVQKVSEVYQPDFIDINMGCPMPKIVNNGDGSALMKNPALVYKIVSKAVRSSPIPVSVKIRKGFTSEEINADIIAKSAEDAGASFITVHGRTREQMYGGQSDLSIIEKVKRTVKIPVIGNGDIFSPEDAKNMLDKTGCDAIMLARGILGNPFLFSQIKEFFTIGSYRQPSPQEKLQTALKQLKRTCEYKNERIAIPEGRKHIAWYLKGMKNSAKIKNEVFKAKTYSEIEHIISQFADCDICLK